MNSKRLLSLVLCFLLSFSCVAFADETKADITDLYESSADQLYVYGLFKGDVYNGFSLRDESSKLQAAVMVVRLIGAESTVLNSSFSHPYTDVNKWASNYVGYLYSNGIRIAESDSKFGSENNITVVEFVALVLEALGYTGIDVADEQGVLDYAVSTGLLTEDLIKEISNTEFNRGTMVLISERALEVKLAGKDVTLLEDLKNKRVLKNFPVPTDEIRYGKAATAKAAADKAAQAAKNVGNTIVSKAKANMGIRYRSGGKSPSTGFDCSGFVNYSMIQSGVWDRFYGSCDGLITKCTKISRDQAQPGDIVFFTGTYKTSKKYTHVGIYLGNNQMVHASSSKGISVTSINTAYWSSHYSCIARPSVLM